MRSIREIAMVLRVAVCWLICHVCVFAQTVPGHGQDPVTLDFQDIPVRSLLQVLADHRQMNMVVSDSVQGNITLRLERVPWDEALDTILSMRGLGGQYRGNILHVAPVGELNPGTPGVLTGAGHPEPPLETVFFPLRYARAQAIAASLREKSGAVLSARGSIGADPRTNLLWVQDDAVHVRAVRNMIGRMDIPVHQILIEARIVNMNRDLAQDFGVRLGAVEGVGSRDEPGSEPAPGKPVSRGGRLNMDLAAIPLGASPATAGLALAKLGSGVLLDLELSALESEGLAEVVASPRLVTENMVPALIESGEEIPYQEATSGGATAVTFKKAVLGLRVTPRVTPDKTIYMELQINQDTPSRREVQHVPAILTREIRTSVLAENGQTVVLGGIHQQGTVRDLHRVPFLGKLPGVGALFRQKITKIRHEELLIFITPRIITGDSPEIVVPSGGNRVQGMQDTGANPIQADNRASSHRAGDTRASQGQSQRFLHTG